MVQVLDRPTGRRERNRAARRRAFLQTARRVVNDEGLGALTMQRVAAELDCAVGTIYTYFPSKSALVAEVQREAIERLTRSYELHRSALGSADPLVRVVGFGYFWVAAAGAFPEESHLLQALMAEVRPALDLVDAQRVLPAALRFLDYARTDLAECAANGSLAPGDAWERTVILAAALNGVMLTAKLRSFDASLDGARLARHLLVDLLAGWGAGRGPLAAAERLLHDLAARMPLAPPVPASEEDA